MSIETLPIILAQTGTASASAVGLCVDEIAVNTKMLQDIESRRRIRAVLKVMGGSLAIKMMVIPAALAVNAFIPWIIVPLLTVGGLHLSCEGIRHLLGKYEGHEEGDGGEAGQKKSGDADNKQSGEAEHKQKTPQEFEKARIKKVLTIDGILSVEITVMTLGIIAGMSAVGAAAVLAGTGLIRTAWMYTLIGGVISLPRVGQWLADWKDEGLRAKIVRKPGRAMVKSTPYVVKAFSVAGTVALLMIGGGLLLHGIPGAEHIVEGAIASLTSNSLAQELLLRGSGTLAGLGVGFAARPVMDALGGVIVKGFSGAKKRISGIFNRKAANDNKTPAAAPAVAPAPVPAPVSPEPAAPTALEKAPDAKDALNKAAAKPANNNTPAPEAKPPVKKARKPRKHKAVPPPPA